jgi:hypothetical protein
MVFNMSIGGLKDPRAYNFMECRMPSPSSLIGCAPKIVLLENVYLGLLW